ncbi:MAG: FAD-dependent oxidoreductase [Verrucomicrobiales bacterium]
MTRLGRFLTLVLLLTQNALAIREITYDVAIYGGTPCGISAAISAAREGATVILIEPTDHIGGLSTSGINTAESEHMLKWTIGGFALEFYQELGKYYEKHAAEQDPLPAGDRLNTIYFFESGVAEKTYLKLLDAAQVRVRYGAHLRSVTKDGTRLRSLILSNESEIKARTFIDASYEGDLMAMAGVSHDIGREARETYDEEAAGIRFDQKPRRARTVDENGKLLPGISGWARDFTEGAAHPGVMNYNFRLIVTSRPADRVPFPAPKHYEATRYALLANWLRENPQAKLTDIISLYKRRNGKFEMNNSQNAIISLGHFGGQFDWPAASPAEREKIYQDHLDYTLGLLHFLASDEAVPEKLRAETRSWGLHREEFADNGHLPYQLYVREGRRMIGAYVVTQHDVQTERRKEDSIGISSHFIDSHHVQRLALSENEFINEGRIWRKGYAYQIPYRSLTPKRAEASNLLVPGAASFSHVAYCTLRLESVWMITGQAAGTAAALAAATNTAVQELPLPELQKKLRQAGQVIDFPAKAPEKTDKLNGPPEF